MGSETAGAESPLPSIGKLSPGPGKAARDVAAHQLVRIHATTVGIVAEQGYKGLKVRDVADYAEVSTRDFYQLFGSKEDCFLQTYELITRRASRCIVAVQAGESDWRKRSQLVFEESSAVSSEGPRTLAWFSPRSISPARLPWSGLCGPNASSRACSPKPSPAQPRA
jgi:AcrR family transcriptional regulator